MADYFQRLKTDCTVNFDPAIEKAVTVYANNNDLVWLLVAKAGTGKSLMIPFQLALLYGYNVVITQLTRKATTNLYEKTERLIRTYSLPVNAECRFRNSGEQGIIKRSSYPTIIYATDGKITNTSYRKALLGQYGKTVLIIDEIQALNKNQEHCISLGRGRFQENVYGFKILMLSAQIDPEGQRFKDITKFFNNKQIEVIYKPLTTNPPFQCQIQYGTREATVVKSKDEAMETAKSLWNKLMEIRKVDKDSGILIFTACLSEAVLLQDLWLSECQCAPRCSFEKQGSNKCKWANAQRKLISIFFRATQQTEHNKGYKQMKGKIVITSNINETAVTMINLKYVIDPGTVCRASYMRGIYCLRECIASRSEIDSRAERANRHTNAVVHRMFAENQNLYIDPPSECRLTDPRLVLATILQKRQEKFEIFGVSIEHVKDEIVTQNVRIDQWCFDELCEAKLLKRTEKADQYTVNWKRLAKFNSQCMDFQGCYVATQLRGVNRRCDPMYIYYVAAYLMVNEPNLWLPMLCERENRTEDDENEDDEDEDDENQDNERKHVKRPRYNIYKARFNDGFAEMTTGLEVYKAYVASPDKEKFCSDNRLNHGAFDQIEGKFTPIMCWNGLEFKSQMQDLDLRDVDKLEFKLKFRKAVAPHMKIAYPVMRTRTFRLNEYPEDRYEPSIGVNDAIGRDYNGKVYCDGMKSFKAGEYFLSNTMVHEDPPVDESSVCSSPGVGVDDCGETSTTVSSTDDCYLCEETNLGSST